MDKPISSLMEKRVVTVGVDDTVDEVETLMLSHKLSCVPVVDMAGGCFGVISLSDLVHFCAMRQNPNVERAWEVCTHKVIEVVPDMSVKAAAELMLKHKTHHILVIENKLIIGIVSSIDLVNEYLLKKADN